MTFAFVQRAVCCSFAAAALSASAANPTWQPADAAVQTIPDAAKWVRPAKSRAFLLDRAALGESLSRAPREFAPAAAPAATELALPMPDGTQARFRVWESPVMAPELAARFPEIKTYCGQGIDDSAATIRFDTTPAGFHAQILSPNGAVYIDPAQRGDSQLHLSYYKRDLARDAGFFMCLSTDEGQALFEPAAGVVQSGGVLRRYRLAVSATGEYTQFHGGTVAAGMAAIVTAVNRVNGIFETELAIRFTLVANNHLLVFTNPTTDPFSNSDITALRNQNQTVVDSAIEDANYDLGIVLCTTDGGVAATPGICFETLKAKCVAGSPSPAGDPFHVDYMAHEIGHLFGAHHTFNGVGGTCASTRSASQAYEPGSGSTIMAYAGNCMADDLQALSSPYFHSETIREIQLYVISGLVSDCPLTNATGNLAPSVDAGPDFAIPKATPFTLTATGSDANGDAITYCWEERDLGAAQAASAADNGSSPLFRSFPPTTSPSRTFPRLADILNNTTTLGEKLPQLARTNRFRVTARDNRAGGGGVTTDDVEVRIIATAGPFTVTAPNTAVTWSGAQTVTWNVAGTTASPISAANVNILLSTDGGNTFPTVLAANTPNDGSQSVVIPDTPTTTARIKVQAAGNIFFDISDANFTIPATALPALTIADAAVVEGNAGRVEAQFALQLSAASAQIVTVNFATANGSALAGLDYAQTNGTAQFAAGQTNQILRVGVLGDTLVESNETFSVLLTAPANATLARSAATGVIVDDEVRLSAATVSNAHVRLQFNSVTGATYRVERSDFLPNTNPWPAVTGATLLPGNGGALQVFDTNALTQPQRFYRVRQVAP